MSVHRKVVASVFALAVLAVGATAGLARPPQATTMNKCASRLGLPDLDCTPGALNPDVKQRSIKKTVCVPKWTDTVRPPTSYTNKLKVQGIADYGLKDKTL